ncbi:MAG: hypothetical protein V1659_04845 [Candidatus Woesearchaeota archaeon]
MASVFVVVGLFFWDLLKLWLSTIFVEPFKSPELLWVLIPLWLSWFFAEFFQEKTGTSMGNAISNAVVVVWACIDSARETVSLIGEKVISGFVSISLRFSLMSIIMAYGVLIIILGIKGNKIIKKIGRIREATYILAMLIPVLYNKIPLSFNHLLATIIFFPLFYFAIELIDKYTPNPKPIEEDLEDAGGSSGSSSSSSFGSSGSDPFGSGSAGSGGLGSGNQNSGSGGNSNFNSSFNSGNRGGGFSGF